MTPKQFDHGKQSRRDYKQSQNLQAERFQFVRNSHWLLGEPKLPAISNQGKISKVANCGFRLLVKNDKLVKHSQQSGGFLD